MKENKIRYLDPRDVGHNNFAERVAELSPSDLLEIFAQVNSQGLANEFSEDERRAFQRGSETLARGKHGQELFNEISVLAREIFPDLSKNLLNKDLSGLVRAALAMKESPLLNMPNFEVKEKSGYSVETKIVPNPIYQSPIAPKTKQQRQVSKEAVLPSKKAVDNVSSVAHLMDLRALKEERKMEVKNEAKPLSLADQISELTKKILMESVQEMNREWSSKIFDEAISGLKSKQKDWQKVLDSKPKQESMSGAKEATSKGREVQKENMQGMREQRINISDLRKAVAEANKKRGAEKRDAIAAVNKAFPRYKK